MSEDLREMKGNITSRSSLIKHPHKINRYRIVYKNIKTTNREDVLNKTLFDDYRSKQNEMNHNIT